MSMGRSCRERQQEFWIVAGDVARTPRHVFYEKLNELLSEAGFDEFVEDLCEEYYSNEARGRPSVPPGVYFRMLFVGYFEGIDSQRGIAWRCADSPSLKAFLGYEPHEETPEHSSLTRIRNRLPLADHRTRPKNPRKNRPTPLPWPRHLKTREHGAQMSQAKTLNQRIPAALWGEVYEKLENSLRFRAFDGYVNCPVTRHTEGFRVNATIRQRSARSKRRILGRLDKDNLQGCERPMFTASNIHYELADRTKAISAGGMGLIHKMVKRLELDRAIDESLQGATGVPRAVGGPPKRLFFQRFQQVALPQLANTLRLRDLQSFDGWFSVIVHPRIAAKWDDLVAFYWTGAHNSRADRRLHPLRRTWAPCGQTPKARVTGKRGGVAALSAISRRGHLLFRLHEKRIASAEVIDFLEQMLRHHKRRHLVVVMDQAPPHVSKKTTAYIDSQSRLHVFHLPKYSPDWNPDEKVWNHLKHQELKGHQASALSPLRIRVG